MTSFSAGCSIIETMKSRWGITCVVISLAVFGSLQFVNFSSTDEVAGKRAATSTAEITYVVDGDTIRATPTGGGFFDGSTSSTLVRLVGMTSGN
jgi:endonuclease YncB( thermonuclease family)